MRLTKTMKNELVESVLKDQFNEEYETLKREGIALTNEYVKSLDDGAYTTLKTAFESVGRDINRYVSHVSRIYFVDWEYDFGAEATLPGGARTKLFKFQDSLQVTDTFVLANGRHDNTLTFTKNDVPESFQKRHAKTKAFHQRVEALSGQLSAVLNSVTTVKKLQELTHVFDPFLPTAATNTKLVPTEALLAVNELKSPKSEATA